MDIISTVILVLYTICSLLLLLYGLNTYWIIYLFLRKRRSHDLSDAETEMRYGGAFAERDSLPVVTTQIPPKDFLRRCLPHLWADTNCALVQARWKGSSATTAPSSAPPGGGDPDQALRRAAQLAVSLRVASGGLLRLYGGRFVLDRASGLDSLRGCLFFRGGGLAGGPSFTGAVFLGDFAATRAGAFSIRVEPELQRAGL